MSLMRQMINEATAAPSECAVMPKAASEIKRNEAKMKQYGTGRAVEIRTPMGEEKPKTLDFAAIMAQTAHKEKYLTKPFGRAIASFLSI